MTIQTYENPNIDSKSAKTKTTRLESIRQSGFNRFAPNHKKVVLLRNNVVSEKCSSWYDLLI